MLTSTLYILMRPSLDNILDKSSCHCVICCHTPRMFHKTSGIIFIRFLVHKTFGFDFDLIQ